MLKQKILGKRVPLAIIHGLGSRTMAYLKYLLTENHCQIIIIII
jgi:hypothetical protein